MDYQVEEFTREVMKEGEDCSGVPSILKALKVLADIVESIVVVVYINDKFNLEMLWKVCSTCNPCDFFLYFDVEHF